MPLKNLAIDCLYIFHKNKFNINEKIEIFFQKKTCLFRKSMIQYLGNTTNLCNFRLECSFGKKGGNK